MKSRRFSTGNEKYYRIDSGIYFARNVANRINYGPCLENIVFQYAKSLGYQVAVGEIGHLECDFILWGLTTNMPMCKCAARLMMTMTAPTGKTSLQDSPELDAERVYQELENHRSSRNERR